MDGRCRWKEILPGLILPAESILRNSAHRVSDLYLSQHGSVRVLKFFVDCESDKTPNVVHSKMLRTESHQADPEVPSPHTHMGQLMISFAIQDYVID